MREGEVELIASPHLLGELADVLHREKFRRYVDLEGVDAYLGLLHREATLVADSEGAPPLRSADPDDDYLIVLADANGAALVSGDRHLLDLADEAPIYSPADFLDVLGR
jgi:putative PIN family toxin of toxin-antitoxin system